MVGAAGLVCGAGAAGVPSGEIAGGRPAPRLGGLVGGGWGFWGLGFRFFFRWVVYRGGAGCPPGEAPDESGTLVVCSEGLRCGL